MRKASMVGMVGAAALLSSGAHATASFSIAGLAVPTMTYTTIAGVAAARTNAYSGVGSIFVNTVSSGMNSGFLCTASLINASTAISAAHCIYDHNESTGVLDPVTRVRLYLPSFGDRNNPGVEVYEASAFQYNPLYNDAANPGFGDIGSGYDVSMISLDRIAAGHDTYSFYNGNPLQQFIEVGTGSTGGPGGTAGANDSLKRTGTNLYELYGDDLFSDVSHGVVLSDFDDGTAAHDVFGHLTQANSGLNPINQLGVAGESNSSPGDSGGPEFINGQIVSVTSFGITGAILQGYCGTVPTTGPNAGLAPSIDPNRTATNTTFTTNLNNCTNSSVGEIAGNTLVSYNMAFINAYLAAHPTLSAVPEPASWAMLLTGFGLVGGAMRSGRRRPATVAA